MKRKLNLKKPEISSEEIAKGRDFQSVLKEIQTAPPQAPTKSFFKSWIGMSTVAAIVAVVVTIAVVDPFSWQKDSKDQDEVENTIKGTDTNGSEEFTYQERKGPFIDPPFEKLDVPYENYKIKGDRGGEIVTKTGSKIKIPKGSLKDENGNAVKGEVEVKVREFHDPVDFFLSGIPMKYDSAGHQYDFESAGMIEVYAFQGGKVLKIDPTKPVSISLRTNSDETKFNVYELDTVGKNWKYQGKDKVKGKEEDGKIDVLAEEIYTWKDTSAKGFFFGDSLMWYKNQSPVITAQLQKKSDIILQEILVIQKDIVKLEERKPLQPKKVTKGLYRFNLEVNKGEFPEIAVYKDVQWEVGPENKDFNDEMYKIQFDNAVIKDGATRGTYTVTFFKGNVKKQVTVYPVFEGADYDRALKLFEEKNKEYLSKVEQKKELEKKKQEDYKQLIENVKKEQEKMKKESDAMLKQMKDENNKQQELWALRANVTREFTIRNFGVWNCDNPHLMNASSMNAAFYDQDGQPVRMVNVCLVNRKLNGLTFCWLHSNNGVFRYSQKGKHFMWTVNDAGQLLACNEQEWEMRESIKMNGTFDKIVLKNTGVDPKTADDIKKYFFETSPSF